MPTTYQKLTTVTVGSGGASTIDFTSIPQIYTDLVLAISARNDGSGNVLDMPIRVGNGTIDTGSNYQYIELTGIPSASIIASGYGTNDKLNTIQPASSATASTFGSVEVYFPNYTSSNYKIMSTDAVTENNSSSTQLRVQAWIWNSTSAINTIRVFNPSGNFAQYSSATLYGIKNS